MSEERWAPIGADGRFEVSDRRRIRKVSPHRGMGDAVRLEPVLSPTEVLGEGFDADALAVKAFPDLRRPVVECDAVVIECDAVLIGAADGPEPVVPSGVFEESLQEVLEGFAGVSGGGLEVPDAGPVAEPAAEESKPAEPVEEPRTGPPVPLPDAEDLEPAVETLDDPTPPAPELGLDSQIAQRLDAGESMASISRDLDVPVSRVRAIRDGERS